MSSLDSPCADRIPDVEEGETLAQAAARELKEETGITAPEAAFRPLAMWESIFPSLDKWGAAKRQHVVCYFEVHLDELPSVIVQAEEVDGYAWLSHDAVQYLHGMNKCDGDTASPPASKPTIDATLLGIGEVFVTAFKSMR